ncbi:MAG: hypothetical protein CMF36_10925 [Leeuwenhoekiella sp.]|nr:hypothetical protein [Leeuwenhoekiella sp.]MBA81636.1 hypothetical protein [Leeuwenhoekiella sp.]|tara:strand:+ start:9188 stop:9670 length:483 start_codon:yes stop_codon:yes gene_type:complete
MASVSCGDRKTDKENDIQLEEREDPAVKGQDMIEEDNTDTANDQGSIVTAKRIVNKYFEALNRGDFTEAYEQMSRNSERGTSSEFAEKNAEIETVTVNFTQDATVSDGANGSEVTLPIRYTVKTKNNNTMTYTGSAVVVKGTGEDDSYQITAMNVNREDT